MADKIKVELIIDGAYTEPEGTIRAGEKSELTDRIIEAIEGAAEAEFSSIPAYSDGKLEFVKQRDIMRIRTEGRQIVLDTESRCYIVRQTLTQLEEELDRSRFIRISQSEIINIYKVKQFDVSLSGTIGIEFKNGAKTYASRRYIKTVKNFLSSKGAQQMPLYFYIAQRRLIWYNIKKDVTFVFLEMIKNIKNKKQLAIIFIIVLCVIIIGTVYYKNVIATAIDYKEAASCYEDYDYLKAYEKFNALGEYKDSKKRAAECSQKYIDHNFNKAIALMEKEDYEGALKLFKSLGDYQGSNQMAEKCQALLELDKQHSKIDPMYSQYYKIAHEYMTEYGKPKVKKDPDNKKSYVVCGVNTLNLIDFNGDGTEELVVGGKRNADEAGEYAIYTYNSGSVLKIYEQQYNHHSGYYAFELLNNENGWQLYSGNTDRGELLSFDGNEFKTELSWENNADDKEAKEKIYRINGKDVSKNKYQSLAPNYNVADITGGFASPFNTCVVSSGSYSIYVGSHMSKSAALSLQSTYVLQTYETLKASHDRTK